MGNGSLLIGIVMPDGNVAFTGAKLTVNDEFIESAKKGRSPEARFRFADKCVQGSCKQWTGTRCGVIDHAIAALSTPALSPDLPRCKIRAQCRWYKQDGKEACAVCPLIVTDCRT
jgi:hypothetical protein